VIKQRSEKSNAANKNKKNIKYCAVFMYTTKHGARAGYVFYSEKGSQRARPLSAYSQVLAPAPMFLWSNQEIKMKNYEGRKCEYGRKKSPLQRSDVVL
jgi:hypothetical protein